MNSFVFSAQITPREIFLRLLLAMVLGSIIGMEREAIHRPAGLRTHTLVSIGSALFTLLSIYMSWWDGQVREPARIAAQVVSGIGFLGAGTILRQRSGVRGLTTAASLWAVSGIGMAAGAGYYFGSALATLFVFLSLTVLGHVEHKLYAVKAERVLILEYPSKERIPQIASELTSLGMQIREFNTAISNGKPELRLNVRLPARFDYQQLLTKLLALGVTNYEWDDPV